MIIDQHFISLFYEVEIYTGYCLIILLENEWFDFYFASSS